MPAKLTSYQGKILKELCFNKPLSASELSIRIGKSLPVTTRVLEVLIKEGLILESGLAPATIGRRPQVFALASEKMYVIAIAMYQLITKIALIDIQNFERKEEQHYILPLKDNSQSLGELINLLSIYISNLKIPADKLLGIGIGTPGFIDITKGVNYSFLENNGKSIPDRIENELRLPVFLDNDSSLIALAELKLGGSSDKNNVMVINLSWGIGLGMILDGRLFRGYNGFAGEFSHLPLFDNNKLCSCGKMGCLETEASLSVLVQNVRKGIQSGKITGIKNLPEDLNGASQAIIDAAIRGDQLAVELLSDLVNIIGKGIAILVHVMNPEEIVISGRGAAAKIEPDVAGPAAKFDLAYGFNFAKWQRYANSMRLRLAMRLSEVDAAKAKAEFEDAVTQPLIMTADETFQVAELDGWHALTGVMTREWNYFQLSATMRNLTLGLGGIESADLVDGDMQSHIKPAGYIGMRFLDHFTTLTNDPSAGYWLDGLPNTIDPRAYKAYIIPGDIDNTDFNSYPSWDNSAKTTVRNLVDADGDVVKTLDASGTWNAPANGDWGTKGAKNQIRSYNGALPRHGKKFRNSTNKRIYFAPWETYFLIAEAAVRNWTVPMSGQAAYEAGIDASFAYWGVSDHATAYKASTDYNMAGTSVNWNHTTEPGASHAMSYVDGYTNVPGVVQVEYPVNNLYKDGTVKNDLLTKIITQKFIAQTPYLPLEAWSDHRRLGLPFFENPAVENPLVNMPALNSSNYKTSQVKFFPQRLKYPSSLQSSNQAGYDQAVSLLGGPDEVLTPLWWAQKP